MYPTRPFLGPEFLTISLVNFFGITPKNSDQFLEIDLLDPGIGLRPGLGSISLELRFQIPGFGRIYDYPGFLFGVVTGVRIISRRWKLR